MTRSRRPSGMTGRQPDEIDADPPRGDAGTWGAPPTGAGAHPAGVGGSREPRSEGLPAVPVLLLAGAHSRYALLQHGRPQDRPTTARVQTTTAARRLWTRPAERAGRRPARYPTPGQRPGVTGEADLAADPVAHAAPSASARPPAGPWSVLSCLPGVAAWTLDESGQRWPPAAGSATLEKSGCESRS